MYIFILYVSFCFSCVAWASEKPGIVEGNSTLLQASKPFKRMPSCILPAHLGKKTGELFIQLATKSDEEKQKLEQQNPSGQRKNSGNVSPFAAIAKAGVVLGIDDGRKKSKDPLPAETTHSQSRSPSSGAAVSPTINPPPIPAASGTPRLQNYITRDKEMAEKPNNNANHPSGSWCCCWSSNEE